MGWDWIECLRTSELLCPSLLTCSHVYTYCPVIILGAPGYFEADDLKIDASAAVKIAFTSLCPKNVIVFLQNMAKSELLNVLC